jgi:hypothetical protein
MAGAVPFWALAGMSVISTSVLRIMAAIEVE